MSVQKLIISQILLFVIVFNLNGVLTIKRDQKQNVNITEFLFDKERDARQYGVPAGYGSGGFGDYGLSSFGGPVEAIIIGLLIVAALGVIGIPFFFIFISLFSNGGGILGNGLGGIGGLNLVPTTTTAVTGRKKRDINSLLPETNPLVQQKLINIFENFIRSPDKIKLIEKLLDSMVGRN